MLTNHSAFLIAFITLTASMFSSARAEDQLSQSLDVFACHISEFLKSQHEHHVAIGAFSGPPTYSATGGANITQQLAAKLKAKGIEVKQKAKLGITGSYSFTSHEAPVYASLPDKKHKFLALSIKASIVDAFGEELAEFSFDEPKEADGKCGVPKHSKITNEQTLIEMAGIPAAFKKHSDPAERDQQLREYVKGDKPLPSRWKNGKLYAEDGSPYSVEFLVGADIHHLKPRAVQLDEDIPFLPINRGEIMQLRIHNTSNYDAATRITLDGISIFEFSEIRSIDGKPKYEHYIVAPGASTIAGWHKNNHTHHAFQLRPFGESAAAKLGQHPSKRTITIVFKPAWPIGSRPQGETHAGRNQDAFGFGPPVQQGVQEVKREIGDIAASISIRYGSAY